jgi:hypothetical protein
MHVVAGNAPLGGSLVSAAQHCRDVEMMLRACRHDRPPVACN